MPKFNVAVDHSMERQEAVHRLRSFSAKMREGAPVELTDLEENWDDDGNLNFAFAALGLKVSGDMVTSNSQVTVSGQIPFAALPFRGQLEKQLETKIREALSDSSAE